MTHECVRTFRSLNPAWWHRASPHRHPQAAVTLPRQWPVQGRRDPQSHGTDHPPLAEKLAEPGLDRVEVASGLGQNPAASQGLRFTLRVWKASRHPLVPETPPHTFPEPSLQGYSQGGPGD